MVSIPQLGWGDFKRVAFHGIQNPSMAFQSLNWDGVISNPPCAPIFAATEMFQSLNWDGVISNDSPGHHAARAGKFQSLNWDGVISNQISSIEAYRPESFNPSIGMG